MRILVTNDDGITAPGLEALCRVAAELGEAWVVAPDSSQSACSHGITVQKPLRVRTAQVGRCMGWQVNGKPADCVKLGVQQLLPERPDLVLSGINAGMNASINALYSGTVAGALEGALLGACGVALSLELGPTLDFVRAAKAARRVLDVILAHGLEPGVCYNVNIPAAPTGEPPRGIRCCAQGAVTWYEQYEIEEQVDERHFTLFGRMREDKADDLTALHAGYVVVTPVRADLTDHARLKHVERWPWPAD